MILKVQVFEAKHGNKVITLWVVVFVHILAKIWNGILESKAVDIGVLGDMAKHVAIESLFKFMLMLHKSSLGRWPSISNMAMGISEAFRINVWVKVEAFDLNNGDLVNTSSLV